MNQMKIDKVYHTERDPLELRKYVDQILMELNECGEVGLKLKRRTFAGRKVKKEKEIIELKELPFVF